MIYDLNKEQRQFVKKYIEDNKLQHNELNEQNGVMYGWVEITKYGDEGDFININYYQKVRITYYIDNEPTYNWLIEKMKLNTKEVVSKK
ncbi:MAG: hypothetical protein LBV58_04540 [Acholeplasmatales bacterium]|jgi:hypothetical protein|nr:hypothetical protein [Acholeplasmatales bacterium]